MIILIYIIGLIITTVILRIWKAERKRLSMDGWLLVMWLLLWPLSWLDWTITLFIYSFKSIPKVCKILVGEKQMKPSQGKKPTIGVDPIKPFKKPTQGKWPHKEPDTGGE